MPTSIIRRFVIALVIPLPILVNLLAAVEAAVVPAKSAKPGTGSES